MSLPPFLTALLPVSFSRIAAALLLGCLLAMPAWAAPTTAPVSTAVNLKSIPQGHDAVLAVVVDVPDGLHAQSSTPSASNYIRFLVTMEPNPAVEWSDPVYPRGEDHEYGALGVLNVYTGKVIVYVPLKVKSDAPAGPLTLQGKLQYQMCDARACFMPQRPKISVETQVVSGGSAAEPNQPELFQNAPKSATASSTAAPSSAPASQPASQAKSQQVTEIAGPISIDVFGWQITLGKDAYALPFFFAFVVGILFNFMPCVLPVVPLKAMGFYEVSQHNRAKSFALGLVFSLGLVASFAVLGLLVVAWQAVRWGEMFSNTWFLLALVIILVVMSASMFGAFTVNVPTAIYRITPRHDTYTGNFLFGVLTAALSTPCTFGMFFGLLAWALAQPVAIGVSIVIVVGMGMAFPYLVLSAFPELARRFPRTGPWAETIKMMLGFLLLGTAVYFAGPFINRALGRDSYWWVILAVAVAAAIFLVWRTVRFSPGWLPRAVAVVIAILMVAPTYYAVRLLTAKPYEWTEFTPAALVAARSQGRIVLVDFTADWCGNCHALEAFVLNSRRAVKTVDDHRVVMLKADVTQDAAPGRPLLNELNPVGAIPLTVIYAPGLRDPIQLTGFYKVGDLQQAIVHAAAATSTGASVQ